jgi:outer membrane receptor protein involved in Fe transport
VFCLALCLPALVAAQEAAGRIVGQITDPQGAVLVGAGVTVTNVATRAVSHAVTDKDGLYQVLHLPIGNYTVAAEAKGFRKSVTVAYPLEINQALKVDLKLLVGTAAETVEVSGAAALVETQNATLGNSVTSRPIINLPLNGRNVLDLAMLEPGVTDQNKGHDGAGTFSIAGGRLDSVTYLLDGGINNDLLHNEAVLTPNPDIIAEFRILESNYSAEYGRNAGGIISMVTKSGGNSFHGSAFEFARNDFFNANSYFNKRNGLPREVLKRNQFGGTVGGPIKKDKAFFFFGYQGQRQTWAQNPGVQAGFTNDEIVGNFENSAGAAQVASFLDANQYFQPDPALRARGIIDPSKINPVAQKFIAAGIIPHSPTGSIVTQTAALDNRNEYTGKLDYDITSKDRLTATLGYAKTGQTCPYAQDTCNPSGWYNSVPFTVSYDTKNYFLNLAYTKTLSNNLLNEFRVTAQRQNFMQYKPLKKLPTAADLGIGTTPDESTGPPILWFVDSGLTLGFSYRGPTSMINNTFGYSDTLSWVKGKHNLKFGFFYSPYQNNTVYDYYVNGEFDFYGSGTYSGTGVEFADFLLGIPDEYYQWPKAPSNIRTKAFAGFAQDEWRVAPNFTLTLGLRYEYGSPKYDTQGRSFSILPGVQSTRFINAPTGLVFPGDPGAPSGANFPDKNDFAPRIGFAWDPFSNGHTSIRGGFGVFYDVLKGEDNLQFNGQPPFFGFTDMYFDPPSLEGTPGNAAVPYFSSPYTWGYTESGVYGVGNPFPSKPPASNINFASNGFLPFGGGGVYFVDNHIRTPYVYQYNLSVQHELTRSLRADIAYVGSSAHKLTTLQDANPYILGTDSRSLNANNAGANFGYVAMFRNAGSQNYNSLQASLKKQMSEHKYFGSSYFTLAYTWAKNIDNGSGFRQGSSSVPYYNPGLFRAVSDIDIQHRLTFSGGWDLPFADFMPSAPKRLVKGWSLYPIVTIRSGFPLDLRAQLAHRGYIPGPSGAGDSQLVRVNLVGNSVVTYDPKAHTDPATNGAIYFDPANFERDSLLALNDGSVPAAGQRTYGTLPRNAFRGPGRTNFDFAIAKATPLVGERMKLEFRAEFFNIFNSAQFDDPNTNPKESTFGEITTTAGPRIIQFGLRLTF